MVDYFITKACKNTTQSSKDMYDCYYAEDTLTNRLFYKEGEHIEEIIGIEKNKILYYTKLTYLDVSECVDPKFYERITTFYIKSSDEESAIEIHFIKDEKYLEKSIDSLEGVKAFIHEGLTNFNSTLRRYFIAHQEYELLLIEALKYHWTPNYINDSVYSDMDYLKVAFAIDMKHFIQDKFFNNSEASLIDWFVRIL